LTELHEAIKLKPDAAQAHTWLGITLQLSGKQEDGLKEIRHAYELDPKDEFVRKTYDENVKKN
jgi:Flp pilus assembly protein TadD